MIYFDSCYIAKFYLAELDSTAVIALAQKQNGGVACSLIGKAEVIAVFHRKFREGLVDVSGLQLLCNQFEADCAQGLWHWLPVDETLLQQFGTTIRTLGQQVFLRASDGLHLTCARESGFGAIHSSDRHLIAAAPFFGLQAISA